MSLRSIVPSVLMCSEVLTRANSVALNMTVPSLLRGMFIVTNRCTTHAPLRLDSCVCYVTSGTGLMSLRAFRTTVLVASRKVVIQFWQRMIPQCCYVSLKYEKSILTVLSKRRQGLNYFWKSVGAAPIQWPYDFHCHTKSWLCTWTE